MKSVDDVPNALVSGVDTTIKKASISHPDITKVSELLEQGNFCKELYLTLGVHPNDVGENSDEDVERILEQMSRLQRNDESVDHACERNIDDILKEAESLLDSQHNEAHTVSQASNRSGGSLTHPSCEFSQACSLRSIAMESASSSQQDLCPLLNESSRTLDKTFTSTFTKPFTECDDSQIKDRDTGCFGSHKDFSILESVNRLSSPHVIGTPLEVTYQRIHEQIQKEMGGSLEAHIRGDFPDLKVSMPIPGVDTPSVDVPSCFSLEEEFLGERKRCLKLKADLDWLKKQHEREVAELRHKHEEQLLQVREEYSSQDEKDARICCLEKQIQSQDRVITRYQSENEEMYTELKDIKRALLKLMALLSGEACMD